MVENLRKTGSQDGLFKLLGALWLLGLGVALRLTWHHENGAYGDTTAKIGFCPETTLINCDVVNSSRYSEVLGIPIALFAIPTYLLLLFLSLRRNQYPLARAAILGVGSLTSLYSLFLLGVSHFDIGYFCLWCLVLYAINFSTLGVGLLSVRPELKTFLKREWAKPRSFRPLFLQSLAVFVLVFALTLSGQLAYRKILQGDRLARLHNEFLVPDFSAGEKLSFTSLNLAKESPSGKLTALIFSQGDSPYNYRFLLESAQRIRTLLPSAQLYIAYPLFERSQPEALLENHLNTKNLASVSVLFDREKKNALSLGLSQSESSVAFLDSKGKVLGSFSLPLDQPEAIQWLKKFAANPQEPFPVLKHLTVSERLEGTCAPSFKLPALTQKWVFSFEPAQLKKPTLLVFWSAGCRHCQEEIPKLLAYHRKHKSELDVISVIRSRAGKSVDENEVRNQTLAFAKKLEMDWPILSDNGYVFSRYLVDSTPNSVLLAPGGAVRKFWKGTLPNLENTLDGALRALASFEKQTCNEAMAPIYPKAPLELLDAGGEKVFLQQLVKKPTLLHFWATWCLPCQEEFPHFLKFSAEMKQKGIETVLVTVEKLTDLEKVNEFLKKYGYEGPRYFSPTGGAYSRINPQYSVPRTYLLGKNGEVLRKYLGVQSWENETFKELVSTWFINY